MNMTDMRSRNGFAHLGLFYDNAAQYLAGVLPFVESALAADTPVMVAVPGDKLSLLRERLGESADKAQLADMTVAGRNPGWILPGVLLEFASRHPEQPVAMVGEPIWPGRSEDEYPACVIHEALINSAFEGRDGAVLCLYDATNLKPTVLDDALQTHPIMVDNGDHRGSDSYADPLATVARFRQPLPAAPEEARTVSYGSPSDLAGLRRFVTAEALGCGFDRDRAVDIAVAVNELASNTIEHTQGAGELTVWCDDGALVCQVDDSGYVSDPLAGYRLPPASARRGRGLAVVNRMSDLVRMHTHPGGTTFRTYFYQ